MKMESGDEKQNDKHPPESVKQVLKAFVASSSVKGASKVLNSKTNCQRILWLLTLISGLTFSILQLVLLFTAYFSYGTNVATEETPNILPFPDISVCNLNPLAANETQRLYLEWFETDFTPIIQDIFPENTSMLQFNAFMEMTYEQYAFAFYLSDARGFWQNTDPSDDSMLKLQLKNFIRLCKWQHWKSSLTRSSRSLPEDVECDVDSESHMRYFFSQHYGPCVTFTLLGSIADDVRAFTTVLYVQDIDGGETYSYRPIPDISYGNGVKVLIHPRGTLPNMINAISISPGYETTVVVDMVERLRLEEPYGTCTSRDTLSLDSDYVYTYEACQSLCGQQHAIDTCGCMDYDEIISPRLRERHNFCGKFVSNPNVTVMNYDCSFYHYSINRKSSCTCLPACKQQQIETYSSQTVWPHKMHSVSFYNDLAHGDVDDSHRFVQTPYFIYLGNVSTPLPAPDYELLRHNFLQLNVKLQGRNATKVADRQAMSINGVVCSLGGILNLWIGITLVTVVEFTDVIYQLSRSRYKEWKAKGQAKNKMT